MVSGGVCQRHVSVCTIRKHCNDHNVACRFNASACGGGVAQLGVCPPPIFQKEDNIVIMYDSSYHSGGYGESHILGLHALSVAS
jgi:hypothetical protein